MTINKQFYEDACKLIEKEGAWIRGASFGLNGQPIESLEDVKKSNCWCYNGALAKVIIGTDDEKVFGYWWQGIGYPNSPVPETVQTFRDHCDELNKAFDRYSGDGFIYYNDNVAKSGQEMANKVREIVAKMEG
jgi:hypothetical protein